MNNRVILSVSCCILLFLLLCAPALAAAVSCPSSCSCLLPAEAKKAGYTGYCGGRQLVCGSDAQKNEKYCYEKTSSGALQPVVTAKTTVTVTKTVTATTTTPAAVQCPSGCTCLSASTGKLKGLPYCGGKQVSCGSSTTQEPMFCFSLITTAATTTQTTAASPCAAGCACLLPDEAKTKGMEYCNGKQTVCAVPSVDPATGAARSSSYKYCYNLPSSACPFGCSCLAPDKADAAGYKRCSGSTAACSTDPLGRPMYCYVTGSAGSVRPVAAGTAAAGTSGTPAPAGSAVPINLPVTSPAATPRPEGGAFAGIGTFFASLFGGRTVPGPQGFRVIDCPGGFTDCDGQCVDLSSDIRNCGRCRGVCYGDGSLCCDGVCSDAKSAEDCGSCGNACSASEPCLQLPGGDPFCSPAGCWNTERSMDCGTGLCVNLIWDRHHCGTCGNACPEGLACEDGACITCPAGEALCGLEEGCRDILTDPDKCGGCNIVCNPDQICVNGRCTACPAGQTRCGHECRDLQNDWNSCGACGADCAWPETCCGGQCANLNSNTTNCGSCGNACGAGSSCIRGGCIYGYPTGDCVGEPCHGECVDYRNDRANCGTCGHACPDRYYCRESTCTPYYAGDDTVCDEPGLDYCSGDCASLQTDERHCGRCGNDCLPGDICCSGVCRDLENDVNNCGDCGHRCAAGQVCCGGECRADTTGAAGTCGACGQRCVGSGISCCDGTCRDLQRDRTNCGSCGHTCPEGRDCCGGSCVNLKDDGHNCGNCGHDCPWNAAFCVEGYCSWWPWAGSLG